MQACDRDPAAFRDALRETATRYHRVAIFKYWHTCCDRCVAQKPVLCIDSKMTLADVTFAHGLSLQGSINMLRSFPQDGNAPHDSPHAHVVYVVVWLFHMKS